MERLALVVAAVWVLLCGGGYLLRVVAGLGRPQACAGVVALYVACAVAALCWLGVGESGVLAASGMVVPCLAAVAGIVLYR